ncbi:MAG: DUF3109 family protein [Chlorobiales bacterium]|nr:DUF3109 family protein [Chlorobiales bacterium]
MKQITPVSLISIEHVLVEPQVVNEFFLCDLQRCKGSCCVEGELGAPVTSEEVEAIERNFEKIKPYLPQANLDAISKVGIYESYKGDLYLTTVSGKECVFASADENGVVGCNIEKAYFDKNSDFLKPVSCHLFPIRVRRKFGMDHLVYVQISECVAARTCGETEKVPLYEFLAPALRRKYGDDWTDEFLAYCRAASLSE